MNHKSTLIGGVFAFILATSCCWLPALIIALGGASTLLAFSDDVERFSGVFMILAALLISFGGYQYYKSKQKPQVILESIITCPNCKHSRKETMPTTACQFFYECTNCQQVLKPLAGDCCVYCSYGSVACPPIQEGVNCCD